MEQDPDFENPIPRWSLEAAHKEGKDAKQSWQLLRIQPLTRKRRKIENPRVYLPLVRFFESAIPTAHAADHTRAAPGDEDNKSSPRSPTKVFANLVVPESPEHTWAPTDPSSRSGKLRSGGLRRNFLDLETVRTKLDLESVCPMESRRNQFSDKIDERSCDNSSSHHNSDGQSGNFQVFNSRIGSISAVSEPFCKDSLQPEYDCARKFTYDPGGIFAADDEQAASFAASAMADCHETSLRKLQAGEVMGFRCLGGSVTGKEAPLPLSPPYLMKASSLLSDDGCQDAQVRTQVFKGGLRSDLERVSSSGHAENGGVVPLACFVTGNMKPISISSAALAKAKAILGDDDLSRFDVSGNSVSPPKGYPEDEQVAPAYKKVRTPSGDAIGVDHTGERVKSPALHTGGGNLISVPASAYNNTRTKFQDVEKEKHTDSRMTLTTLRTANGNPISVSASALERVRELFREEDGRELDTFFQGGTEHAPNSSSRTRQCGPAPSDANLETAEANKRLTTSGEGFRPFPDQESRLFVGTKALMAEQPDLDKENRCPEGSSRSGHLNVYETVSSGVAAQKASKAENAIGIPVLQMKGHVGVLKPPVSNMNLDQLSLSSKGKAGERAPSREFETRSGRVLTISSEAIEKAKVMIESGERIGKSEKRDVHGQECGNENKQNIGTTTTYQTRSQRTIGISSGAIEKARYKLAEGEKKISPCRPVNGPPTSDQASSAALRSSVLLRSNGRTLEDVSESRISKDTESARSRVSPPREQTKAVPLGANYCLEGESILRRPEDTELKLHRIVSLRHPQSTLHQNQDTGGLVASSHFSTNSDNVSGTVKAIQPPRYAGAEHARKDLVLFPGDEIFRQICCGRPPTHVCETAGSNVEISGITADAAEAYRIEFDVKDDGRQSVGALEIRKLLLELGVDGHYATEEWVANHYKWIVWKTGSFYRRNSRRGRMVVTVDRVLQQLKYRYDIESSGRRPAIMRVASGSVTAAVRMILCVSAVRHFGSDLVLDKRPGHVTVVAPPTLDNVKQGVDTQQQQSNEPAMIEVTDGWYRLNAVLDTALTKLLQQGKLKEGQNIQVCGASLRSSPNGSSPFEAFQENVLKIHMNGTYRVRRDQRLGFCKDPFIPLSFDLIKSDGGVVPQTLIGVTRVYPVLLKEMYENGISIIRSVRAEEVAINKFADRRAKVIDEAILRSETTSKLTESPEQTDEDDKFFGFVENAAEPDIIMADMTPGQLKAFATYQDKKETRRRAIVDNFVKDALHEAGLESRNVRCLLKVRVVGLKRRGQSDAQEDQPMKEGIVTLWDTGSEQQPISEGSVYRVYGLKPATWVSTHYIDHIQLNSSTSSRWRKVPESAYEKDFLEFDIAALVVQVGEPFTTGASVNQWIFVTDGTAARNCPQDTWDEMQILAIHTNLKSAAFVPVEASAVGSIIGYCNLLQRPKDRSSRLWVAEATELAYFSSNFKDHYLKHLRSAGACVTTWLKSNSWMVDTLKDHLQTLIGVGPSWQMGV